MRMTQVSVAPRRRSAARRPCLPAWQRGSRDDRGRRAAREEAREHHRCDRGDEQGVEFGRDADLGGHEEFTDEREDLTDQSPAREEHGGSCGALQDPVDPSPSSKASSGRSGSSLTSVTSSDGRSGRRRPGPTSGRGSSRRRTARRPRSPGRRSAAPSGDASRSAIAPARPSRSPARTSRPSMPSVRIGRSERTIEGDDGTAHGHRLEEDVGEALDPRGQDENAGAADRRRRVMCLAGQGHARPEPAFDDARSQPVQHRRARSRAARSAPARSPPGRHRSAGRTLLRDEPPRATTRPGSGPTALRSARSRPDPGPSSTGFGSPARPGDEGSSAVPRRCPASGRRPSEPGDRRSAGGSAMRPLPGSAEVRSDTMTGQDAPTVARRASTSSGP